MEADYHGASLRPDQLRLLQRAELAALLARNGLSEDFVAIVAAEFGVRC